MLRSGACWDRRRRSFELSVREGADIVLIESIGGKPIYDCRLMNAAAAKGQAAALSPAATWRIAQAIVGERGSYRRTVAAGRAAVEILTEGMEGGKLKLSGKERQWLERTGSELGELPGDEAELLREFGEGEECRFDAANYGLEALVGC